MTDTTVKVDSAVRDRLATLAAERGTTIRDLVAQLATQTPTRADLAQRQVDAAAYIRKHIDPDFDDDDQVAGENLWRGIREDQQRAEHQHRAGVTRRTA